MFNFKQNLKASISAAALSLSLLASGTASAEDLEKDRYLLRLSSKIFDGNKEFTHNQYAGLARIRNGDQSYVQLDYHDGVVAIDRNEALEISRFNNESGQEAAFLYDYTTHTISGGNDVAENFNTYIRPLMAGNLVPGEDANWTQSVQLNQLGLSNISNLSLIHI